MLNKKKAINRLVELRDGTLEYIIRLELSSKANNVTYEGINYEKGYVQAIDDVLDIVYDYKE